jgi:predicted nucleic acid-binding protein
VSYLLDTNVISELARPKPDSYISAWFASVPDETLHLSVLTLGEIRKGVERLPASRKRERLRLWLEHDLAEWFAERLLPIDTGIADRWGCLLAETARPLPAIDSLLAATALHHGLRFVTRNAHDFAFPGLEVIDPCREARP